MWTPGEPGFPGPFVTPEPDLHDGRVVGGALHGAFHWLALLPAGSLLLVGLVLVGVQVAWWRWSRSR